MIVFKFPVISETFIINHACEILERGHDLTIFVIAGSPKPNDLSETTSHDHTIMSLARYGPSPAEGLLGRIVQSAGWLARNSLDHGKPLVKLIRLNVHRPRELCRLFEASVFLDNDNRRYDVIHAQFGTLGQRAVLLRESGLIEGPILTHFRGFDISSYVRLRGNDVYNELFARGDYFVANCEFFRQEAIRLGCPPERIGIIGSGIDLALFTYRPSPWKETETKRVLSVGRLVEKKGWAYSIRAVADQIRSGSDLEYKIVGEGEERAKLQRLINDLGVQSRIRLIGKREPQEIVQLLRDAHLFLAPSVTSASGDADAPVNTLKEAMATGVPVISTHHGGIPELIEDDVSGLLVPERDSTALGQAIARLAGDPDLHAKLVKAARKQVQEKYDKEKLNQELMSLYSQMAADFWHAA